MIKPLVCFLTWNRAGVGVRNLKSLLECDNDFELMLLDNNSQDNTWNFIVNIDDDRIILKKRFDKNMGSVYAVNYAISKIKKDQYFIYVESDVYIQDRNWVKKFVDVMNSFPELGFLSAIGKELFEEWRKTSELIQKGDISYYKHLTPLVSCSCMSPKVIETIGYYNEEYYCCDSDMRYRIATFTPFSMGILPSFHVTYEQFIPCEECIIKDYCKFIGTRDTCISCYQTKYQHRYVAKECPGWHKAYLQEIEKGIRTPYCASMHDEKSIQEHYYDKERAEANLRYFIENAN